MTNTNIKASYSTMFDKQFKLSDFVPEFSRFRTNEDKNRIGCQSIDNNLFISTRKGKKYFKPVNVACPKCGSHDIVKNGTYSRKLIFLTIGEQNCIVQKYKCNKCGHILYTDLSSIVNGNSNITIPVIEHIEYLYSYFNGSLHKIRKSLKKEHNIEISHQSIENVILKSEYEIKHENWAFSGYYLFDALWVKKNGEWNYLLALFDLELNTIVAKELVDSETVDNVYNFLNQSLRNQNKYCIITDLKQEYRVAIDRLQIKQQFCTFHTKQLINREIKDYIDKNNTSEEEIEIIHDYKRLFFNIIDADSINDAKEKRNKLIYLDSNVPNVIHKLAFNLIIPEFKKLINYLNDSKIAITSNKIENCFLKNFPKHIKKLFKTDKGILKRFNLKLKYWDEDNAIY